jgi:hypothetical protein
VITHIVHLKFKSSCSEPQIHSALTQLGNLRTLIPTITHFSCGKNCSPENLNKGFTHTFIMKFEDSAGREVYLNHPEHIRIASDIIMPILDNALESALVMDYDSE